eukprot:SAG31_NODE_7251_length_1742_cov_1.562386_3_plen_59_part_00
MYCFCFFPARIMGQKKNRTSRNGAAAEVTRSFTVLFGVLISTGKFGYGLYGTVYASAY